MPNPRNAAKLAAKFASIKTLIEGGNIETFQQIFLYVPKTVVQKKMGMNFARFSKALKNPGEFKIDELVILAGFFDMDPKKLIDLGYDQRVKYKKEKLKK